MKDDIRLPGDKSKYARNLIFLRGKDMTNIDDWAVRSLTLSLMEDFFASASLSAKEFFTDTNNPAVQFAIDYITAMFNNTIGMTHSGYLKYYHILLANNAVKKAPTYDLAILDEAQDVSAAALEIFKPQKSHKYLLLGDPHQAIMASFARSVNAFDVLKGTGADFTLSKSFRVSTKIAPLVQSFCEEYVDKSMTFTGMDYEDEPIKTHIYLSKTNSGAVGKMLDLYKKEIPFKACTVCLSWLGILTWKCFFRFFTSSKTG